LNHRVIKPVFNAKLVLTCSDTENVQW